MHNNSPFKEIGVLIFLTLLTIVVWNALREIALYLTLY